MIIARCGICKRLLNVKEDDLSENCGGDCWGCVGECEAEGDYLPSLLQVYEEWRRGLRPNWTPPELCRDALDKLFTRLEIAETTVKQLKEPRP